MGGISKIAGALGVILLIELVKITFKLNVVLNPLCSIKIMIALQNVFALIFNFLRLDFITFNLCGIELQGYSC